MTLPTTGCLKSFSEGIVTIKPPAMSSAKPGDLVGEPSDVLLADVGQQQIDLIGAGSHFLTFGRAGDAAAIYASR